MRFALTTLGWIGLAHVVILLKKERDICAVQEDKQQERGVHLTVISHCIGKKRLPVTNVIMEEFTI